MSLEYALLKTAEGDLQAANHLFEKKLYPQAVFFLQQAVEKAFKSLGIHDRAVTEEDLKKFKHDPTKIFIKFLEFWKRLGLAIKESRIVEFLPELGVFYIVSDLPNRINDLENLSKFFEQITIDYKSAFISEKKIEEFLSSIMDFREEIENMKRSIIPEQEWKIKKEKLFKALKATDRIAPGSSEFLKKEIEKRFEGRDTEMIDYEKSQINLYHDLGFCHMALIYLSLILLRHVEYPRYPKNGWIPQQIYNDDFPLVKKFPKISEIVSEVLSKMNRAIKE